MMQQRLGGGHGCSPAPAAAAAPAAALRRWSVQRHPPRLQAAAPVAAAAAADPYTQVAQLCAAAGPVAVGETPRGRGLVLSQDMPEREDLLLVPLQHALVIADEPTSGLSIFSDKQHRRWQEVHGPLPPLLLEFLQGDARWDARMAAWLLWMVQHPGPLWRSYIALLPAEPDMSCLLNFSPAEIEELQVPALKEEAAVQASWCAHLHAKYFSAASGSLAPLGLSHSLAHSLWAISLVRSRTFSEDVNGEMLTLMVPYCDMANHCSDNNSTFCISRDFKSFSLRSLRPLSKGEELTISYGSQPDSLRDYGFVLQGNRHGRVAFGGSSTQQGSGAAGAVSDASNKKEEGCSPHGLNEACLMEAAGFTGDLAAGKIQPAAASTAALADPQLQQQLARREAVLLSLPLKSPPGSRSRSSSSGGGGGGGLFGWLLDVPQPWTESGRPPPQPLRQDQAAAERAAVQALQQQLRQQLAALPTSIQADQALLAQLEAAGSSLDPQNIKPAQSSSSSNSSSTQQRRQSRLQEDVVAPRPPRGDDRSRPASRARSMTAIRARLEHKLLLQEGLEVLDAYERYLATRFCV